MICFNKSGYGPVVHSHIAPTSLCLLFYCPVNRAQARAAFMGLVLGREERHKKKSGPSGDYSDEKLTLNGLQLRISFLVYIQS